MKLGRRQLLVAGGALFASCKSGLRRGTQRSATLDELLAAQADALPENAGGGANHYPMAAEALEALGHADGIERSWVEDGARYAGEPGRAGGLVGDEDVAAALGHYERFGDWLDHFRAALRDGPWRAVVRPWAPRLAPGLCAAAYHGVIRTGHAVRALRRRDTAARRNELAVGLAYWASRYTVLPTAPADLALVGLHQPLADLEHPWGHDRTDVDFFSVVERLTERPITPPVSLGATGTTPRADLQEIVHAAATAFLEMLVLERSRIWLLHTVTGPAAVEWLLPEVDERGARALVEYARQSVVAMHFAYGEPHVPGRSVRGSPSPWPELVRRAVDSRSVHGIKLIDALVRFDHDGDPLWRSVAEQWFEWT